MQIVRMVSGGIAAQIGERRVGKLERINLRGGKMYLYFTGRDNKAYYQSAAFGRMVTYMQMNFRRVTVRDNNGKRSMIINDVPTVRAALDLLTTIRSLPAT